MRAPLLIALALVACSRAPSAPRGSSSASSASAASPSASASTGATLGATPPLPDGCWTEVDRNAELGTLAALLARACAPETRALIEPRELELAERGSAEIAFDAPGAGACVRVIAASSPSIEDVGLELVDGAGKAIAKDFLTARFALLGARGPVCVSAGAHKLIVSAKRGSGRARVELRVPAGDGG